jgi:hypothetical protein
MSTPAERTGTDSGDRPGEEASHHPWLLPFVRYVLPGIVVLAGIVVMALGSETDLEGGGGIVSAGLAIYFINWLFRTGAAGDRERDDEERAREYFDLHGRWPD